jgi:hypothetical protein
MSIEAQTTEISELIRAIRSRSARNRLKAELEGLNTRHQASAIDGTDTTAVEAELACLRKAAAIAAQMGTCSWFMMFYLSAVSAGFFVALYLYFDGLGPARYSSIEATRPILVFTLIVAMLGFGGLLIYRALFSPDGGAALQERFRLAREIFLVYAGIFGTIIGFYFGAADNQNAAAPTLRVAVAAQRQLSATVDGGSAPFLGVLTLAGQTGGTTMTVSERTLSASVPETICPHDASIVVVDGLGRRAETKVTQTNDALRAVGWTACPAGSAVPAPPVQSNATGNAATPVP